MTRVNARSLRRRSGDSAAEQGPRYLGCDAALKRSATRHANHVDPELVAAAACRDADRITN
ncbi:hypothetical protein CHELA40_14947 [Chelatococcus asaccharovorans]|nr:hypothetical protein CHELA17_60675 [Chelatococcus asaccharovorans]CAH1680929.1 hypothetical protein CHELA40_14947 [Chelatococcus asaccharovorans]